MIDFSSIQDSEGKPIAFVVTIDGKESMEAFKKLVFRATNLWPDATAEIKEFSDKLEHGKVLQDYASQDTSPSGKLKAAARAAKAAVEEDIARRKKHSNHNDDSDNR